MVDKASTISLKEIRDYLMETDALENAESILLHNRIDRLNKKVVKTAGDSDEKKFSVDAVKISQLLGDIDPHDNRNKEKERYDSNSVGNSEELVGQREARTTAGLTKQKYDEFMEFERIAQQEVLELERKKELMMSKLYDNRQKIEVYRLVNEPNRDSQRKNDNGADDADKIGNGHSVGGPLTKDSVHQLVELSQNHARKMAESKARAEALERELQQLRQGKTSVDLDLIRSLTKRPAGKNPVESLSCDRNNSER